MNHRLLVVGFHKLEYFVEFVLEEQENIISFFFIVNDLQFEYEYCWDVNRLAQAVFWKYWHERRQTDRIFERSCSQIG